MRVAVHSVQEGFTKLGQFCLLGEFPRHLANATTQRGGKPNEQENTRRRIVVYEFFEALARYLPVLALVDSDHRTNGLQWIEEIHFTEPFASLNLPEENVCILVDTAGMKKATNDQKQLAVGDALLDQDGAWLCRVKPAIAFEDCNILGIQIGNDTDEWKLLWAGWHIFLSRGS